ncbi:MAG TPA: rhomboid family intramembrane serine protease [Candidatus Nanoarchaeia archaeon]|nr:rhomboid family intramembrane serine protease [Candidatus Nanoarchaeia archaeon]
MRFKFYALWLCLVCIVVFFLQLVIAGFTELFVLDERAYVQLWRFVSAIFLHGGMGHLLSNVFALALFGSFLEGFIGGRRFLFVFFLTGIFANVVALSFYPSSLGASGAIFGVIGCLVVIRPLLVVWAFGLPMPLFVAGALWVIGDIIGVFVPSGVGNIAHLSGIALGIFIGLFLRDWKKRNPRNTLRLHEGFMRSWEDRHLR